MLVSVCPLLPVSPSVSIGAAFGNSLPWSPRRDENPCLQVPKSTLWSSKIEPRSTWGRPGAPKSAQERPKSDPRASEERPKSAQERPKSAQERSKSAPRAPQERPRAPQEHPGATQERPRAPQEGPRTTQELLLIVIYSATRSRSAFVTIFDRVSHRARKRADIREMYVFPIFLWFSYVFR